MSSRSVVVACAVAALVMALLDAAWIGLVASDLYRDQLGAMVAETPRWGPALAFYVLFWATLCRFVVVPGVRTGAGSLSVMRDAAWIGAVAYGTWALTGMAVLAGMTWPVALSDFAWGPVMGALTAVSAVAAGRRWGSDRA